MSAYNTQHGVAALDAAVAAVTALANSGYLHIYDGAQPAGDTPITTQNLLSSHRFSATAFGAASGGVADANAISMAVCGYSSTAAWYEVTELDGVTRLWTGSVGTSGANLNFPNLSFTVGEDIVIDGLTYTALVAEAGV